MLTRSPESVEESVEVALPPRARLLAAVVIGTYAWVLTVLPATVGEGWSSVPSVVALLGLLCLYGAPLAPRVQLSVVLALDGFLGFSFLSLFLTRDVQVNPPFPVFGAFGWVVFTFALGSVSRPGKEETGALGEGTRLNPRTPPSLLAALSLALILVFCLLLLGSAWSITRPTLSVLGHVLVLFAVLLLLGAGANLSTYLQSRGTRLSRPLRLRRALTPLVSLVLLSLAWIAIRHFAG